MAYILFIDQTPKITPRHGPPVQSKPPGGKKKPGETLEDALRRETLEETGLSIKLRCVPKRIHFKNHSDHWKSGFLTPRSLCRGRLKTVSRKETKSEISAPYPVTVAEGLRKVYWHPYNKFHHEFLLAVAGEMTRRGLLLEPAPADHR